MCLSADCAQWTKAKDCISSIYVLEEYSATKGQLRDATFMVRLARERKEGLMDKMCFVIMVSFRKRCLREAEATCDC